MSFLGIGLSIGNAVGGLFAAKQNREAQININRDQLQYAKESYDKQRADALADRDYSNAFNSPSQQMQRYKEAGLNPNLIYGSATNSTSAVVRGSTPGNYSPKAPEYINPLAGALSAYINLSTMMAQTENLRAMAALNRNKADIASTDSLWRPFQDKAQVELLTARAAETALKNKFTSATMNDSIATISQKLTNIQKDGYLKDQMLTNLQKKADLDTLEYILKSHGLDGNDPLYIKSLMKFLSTGLLDDTIKFIDSNSKFKK